MKAMLLHELGGPVKPAEVPVPKVGPNDALLRLKATGVGLTVVIMKSTPGLVTGYPRILGHEVAGVVEEVGAEVQNVRVGERVTCHFYLTCHNCAFCRSGRETLCPNFRGFVGMACDGGYAEYMAVPALNLCPIPEELSLLDACVVADAVCTPYHACGAEGRVAPGEQVVIIGAGGGVGIHAVQMAQVFGGRVLAADISE
ncbi:MAG: alcohol dehydrogenase catalytic domain-containing protein, partial [Nitrospinota bacterium]